MNRTTSPHSPTLLDTPLYVAGLRWLLIGIAVPMVLAGCSALNIGADEYSCPGMPNGVQCLSARDIYIATNNGKVPRPIKPEEVSQQELPSNSQDTEEAHAEKSGDPVIDNYVAPRLPDRPIPIRTPAEVMRIWIAPWEDSQGDLIVTGYVYTEIAPRRWVIADPAPNHAPVLRPLQTMQLPTKAIK